MSHLLVAAPTVRIPGLVQVDPLWETEPLPPALHVESMSSDALPWLREELRTLREHAAESNVFFEHGPLSLAASCLEGAAVEILTVRDEAADDMLVGYLPIQMKRKFMSLPLEGFHSFAHPYCLLASPIVRRGYEAEFWPALLEWFKDSGARYLEFTRMRGDGELFRCLEQAVGADPALIRHLRCSERDLLRSERDDRDSPAIPHSDKRLKELRQLRRRLADEGRLEMRLLSDTDDLSQWVTDFLTLEGKGSKTRVGTVMAGDARLEEYFQRLCHETHSSGQLMMGRIDVDGNAIAMQVNLRSGSGAFAFRIAVDEDYQAFSPGALLQHALTEEVHGNGVGQWIDSCADLHHPMINRLACEQQRIAAMVIMKRSALTSLILGIYEVTRVMRRALGGSAVRS